MRVAILAGGRGSRLGAETDRKPKPLVEIGGRPILWHILQTIAHQGFRDFLIALGYRGESIQRYFLGDDASPRRGQQLETCTLKLVDTGADTANGGRLRRLLPHLGHDTFLMAFADGVSNVDLKTLVDFHRRHGKLATVAAVRPPPRFGHLGLDGDRVAAYAEKPPAAEGWISGGFFVLEPGIVDYLDGDDTAWEDAPLERLVRDGELMAYRHEGFWQCMDTRADRLHLEALWGRDEAPWKLWS